MKKIATFATIAISLLLCTISFAQEQAEIPKYQDGDYWIYRLKFGGTNPVLSSNRVPGDYLFEYSASEFKIFRLKGQEKIAVDPSDRRGIGTLMNMFGTATPTSKYLEFPLARGKQWSVTYQSSAGGSRVLWVRGNAQVTGIEQLITPAGTLQTFKIERRDVGPGDLDWNRVYFYSPQTGTIVKFHHETKAGDMIDTELIKFGSAKKPD